ncbi:DUF2397 domain-containing protein [Actinotignum sp. GS-2025g]|uniref:DUF2397 domain-containing protein n=1 Tax=unclassified Actinotignum TaxID=2632702 RepID=UPI003F46E3A5
MTQPDTPTGDIPAWAGLDLPAALKAASFLTSELARQYRLIVKVLYEQREFTLTGVSHHDLFELVRGYLPTEGAERFLEEFNFDARMASLVEWGTCTAWQDDAETEEDFLRNRYRYQLTEAGSKFHEAALAIENDLGTQSTASLLAPAILAKLLEETLEQVQHAEYPEASQSFAQVESTLSDMRETASQWQSRLASALGGEPTRDKIVTTLETILAYSEVWGSGVDACSESISRLVAQLQATDMSVWKAMAIPRHGSKAAEETLLATARQLWRVLDVLDNWFTGSASQAKRLRRQIRDAVAPTIQGHRALLAVSGTISRKADLLRLAERLEQAPDEETVWDIWCATTGLYSTRHVTDTVPDISAGHQQSAWETPPVPISRKLRVRGPRAVRGRPAQMINRQDNIRKAKLLAAQRNLDIADAAEALAKKSGSELSEWGTLNRTQADLLLDLISGARRHKKDTRVRESRTKDGKWRLRFTRTEGSAVIETEAGRLVLANGIVEFTR